LARASVAQQGSALPAVRGTVRTMSAGADHRLAHQWCLKCVSFSSCQSCYRVDKSDWLDMCQKPFLRDELPTQRRRAKDRSGQAWGPSAAQHIEDLFKELFHLHDLNGNGLLEEMELVKLNEKIALLHYGRDADISEVRAKYTAVFRAKLDPNGDPVPFERFRAYAREVVDGLDRDPEAQEMILEQFVAEAQSGRQAFCDPALVDESDLPFISSRSKMDWNLEALRIAETSREVVMCSNTCETPFSLVRSNSFDAPFWRSCSKAPPDILWL